MSESENEVKATKQPVKYSKEKILNSTTYKDKRDLIAALLTDGQEYTKSEVKKLIKDYLERGVK